MKKKDLNRPEVLIGEGSKYVGMSQFTMKDYEKKGYLRTPVVRDANGRRRYSRNQLKELREIWLARNPDRVREED